MESYKGELAKTKERVNKLQNREQKHLDKFMILGKYWIKVCIILKYIQEWNHKYINISKILLNRLKKK